jgi:hypothetical protein
LFLPSSGISTSRGGGVGSETNFVMSSSSKQLGCERLFQVNQYSEAEVTVTNLVRRTTRRVLGTGQGVYGGAQPLDNVLIVDFVAGHPRRIFVARVLVPESVSSHQRLHSPHHELKATCSALSLASLKALIFIINSGS